MTVLDWLRENYGWKAKGRIVLFVLVGALFVISLLYMAESGRFKVL